MDLKPYNQYLSKVLSPVGVNEFFDVYWEKKPMYIARSDAVHFSDLLSVAQIEQALSVHDLYFPAVQLTQSDKPIAAPSYADQDSRIIPLRFLQLHNAGATIVMSEAHKLIGSLSNFSREVQASLMLRCQTNVYLSPPGTQGFNTHYDTHDVFVLQVSGSKTFNFYSGGIDTPFSDDAFDPERHTADSFDDQITVHAGDTLYIPRGVMHDAKSLNDQSSLHITLGVYPVVMRDLLQEMVQVVSEKQEHFRRSIPRAEWIGPGSAQLLLDKMLPETCLTAFSPDVAEEAITRLRDHIALQCSQDCKGLLTANEAIKALDINTCIEIKSEAVISLDRTKNGVRLRTFGQVIEFEEPMSSAVAWLVSQQQVHVADFPELNEDQAIALVQQLLRENVIGVRN